MYLDIIGLCEIRSIKQSGLNVRLKERFPRVCDGSARHWALAALLNIKLQALREQRQLQNWKNT